MYLMLSDFLDYLNPLPLSSNSKLSLNIATLDDFDVRLNIKREIAKTIYKVRIKKIVYLPLTTQRLFEELSLKLYN